MQLEIFVCRLEPSRGSAFRGRVLRVSGLGSRLGFRV